MIIYRFSPWLLFVQCIGAILISIFSVYLSIIPIWCRSIMNVDCSAVISLLPVAQNILQFCQPPLKNPINIKIVTTKINIQRWTPVSQNTWELGYKKIIPICETHGCCISRHKTTDVGQKNNYSHLDNIVILWS